MASITEHGILWLDFFFVSMPANHATFISDHVRLVSYETPSRAILQMAENPVR
jgi:hypothetical protein